MALPVVLAAGLGAVVTRILPWVLGLAVAAAAYYTDILRDFFFWMITQLFTFLFWMLSIFGDTADNQNASFDLGQLFSQLPTETLALLGIARVPESFTILFVGFAVRIVRKTLLRN